MSIQPSISVAGAGIIRLLAVVFFGLVGAVAAVAQSTGGKQQLSVRWNDPEIKSFRARASKRGIGVRSAEERRMEKLRLPVLGYRKSPASVRSLGARLRPRRSLVMDEDNPVWYEISYDYGDDVKITIEADLRIQTRLPPGAKVYTPPRNLAGDPEISVFDDKSEIGMMGAIAEFKVEKFGIPYSVTVECSDRRKALCRDIPALKRDRRFLEIIAASPPR